LLHAPALIDVARRNAESELVAQLVHPVDGWRKRELLTHLVSSGDWRQVLVFTRMKSGANRLAEYLCKAGIEATAIHGNKSQPARTRALAGFKAGTVRVLVATDIAARGLDIEELPHVVNFELPNVPADYVHRIGRTGRAGSTGVAISLVSAEEGPLLADIEKLLTRRIERQIVAGFEPGQVQPPAVAEAQAAAERAARDANRRGTGHPGKPGKPGKPAAARPSAPAAKAAGTPRFASGATGAWQQSGTPARQRTAGAAARQIRCRGGLAGTVPQPHPARQLGRGRRHRPFTETSEQEPVMNIFVGNLAPETDETELTDLFKAFGQVKSVQVMRELFSGASKGFGFVEMPGKAHSLAAIAALDGKDLHGKPLRVNEAMARGSGGMRHR
jgi:superfamily II DNA/RNA helicase